jgi:hypothetical protein
VAKVKNEEKQRKEKQKNIETNKKKEKTFQLAGGAAEVSPDPGEAGGPRAGLPAAGRYQGRPLEV